MPFTTPALLVTGFLTGIALVHLFASLKIKNLRTIPKPPEIEMDKFKRISAEARAGVKLQQACYNNDPLAASEALTMWAWASGESDMANSLDQKREALKNKDLRTAISALWAHLESKEKKTWFGDCLWRAFLDTNPEFRTLEGKG